MDTVYLDHAATTPVRPEVLEAMLPFLQNTWGNPSSAHRIGRGARAGLEQAKREVADSLGVNANEVIFTSGGTECTTFAECKDLLDNGEDINYRGYTGTVWNDDGDPAEATIGIFEYGADNNFTQVEEVVGRM